MLETPFPQATYSISTWRRWAEEVADHVEDFRQVHGVYPNALVANHATFVRIDMAADREAVVDEDGCHPAPAEYAPLAGLAGPDFTLTFLVNEEVPERMVQLVYEGDDDDGEPVVDDTQRVA